MQKINKKIEIEMFFLFAIEMSILSVFLWKKGLGPLGVKVTIPKIALISNSIWLPLLY